MLAAKTMPRPTDAKCPQQSGPESETVQSSGLNRSLLASFGAPNMPPVPVRSLNFLPPAGLPMGLPGLQTQFLMGRSLFRPLAGMPASSLGQLTSGIQALQGYQQQAPVAPSQQRGRPNAKEIQDALETLAAATAHLPNADRLSRTDKATLPAVVFMDCDEESLSDYQCLLRKQIEVFEA
jgi:hypothetical protein